MKLLETLRHGRRGVRLVMPAHMKVCAESAEHAELVDEKLGARWDLFFKDVHLGLSPESHDALRDAMRAYARDMFAKLYDDHPPSGSLSPSGPRTDDPTWPALVDFEPTRVHGADALVIVHRMLYDPGREIILGHLLVPVRTGTFEARVMLRASETGWRESALLLIAMRRGTPLNERGFLPQEEMDDPRHDESFPEHVLSRARRALRWLSDDAGLEILDPSPLAMQTEVELGALGCALVPPRGFVATSVNRDGGWFTRTSFSTTDGVETFGVVCAEAALGRVAGTELVARAQTLARGLLEGSDVREVEVHIVSQEDDALVVVAEGRGHMGALRHVYCFFADEHGTPWYVCILGIAAISCEARASELQAVRATFRALRPRPDKKWWRPW